MLSCIWLILSIAACFYNFTPILIAQDQSVNRLCTILEKTRSDALIAGAGSVPLNTLVKRYQGLNQVIWVVPGSSRHLDWNEVSEGEGGKADISTWHDVIVQGGEAASSELPASEPGSQTPNVILVSEPTDKVHDYEIVGFTQTVCSPVPAPLPASNCSIAETSPPESRLSNSSSTSLPPPLPPPIPE